jgi:hypothetical protein
MGKFDGPHFRVQNEDVVSVWAAAGPLADLPEDYFTENYGEDDDEPFNRFSADFGFGYYDHDFVEAHGAEAGRSVPVAELLGAASYGSSFRDEAARQAERLGVGRASFVFIMYNFRYDPAVTGVRDSEYLRFVGVFPYNRGS